MHLLARHVQQCICSHHPHHALWAPLLQVTNGETGFLAYETRFWFPSEQSMSYSPFYYSYEVRFLERQNANSGPRSITAHECYWRSAL